MKIIALVTILLINNLWAFEVLREKDIINKQVRFQIERLAESSKEQAEFVQKQREMIEGKGLKLWGIGLFSGTDPFAYGIKLATASRWSHVAVVLIDENKQKYCYESNGSLSQLLKRIRPEVQIHKWEEVVSNYSGQIATRKFRFSDSSRNEPHAIQQFVYKRLGTPYEKDLEDLVLAVFRENKEEKLTSVFCSEEAAHILMEFKYLANDRLDANYIPRDFSQQEFIPLVDCRLGKEKLVKKPGVSKCCFGLQ